MAYPAPESIFCYQALNVIVYQPYIFIALALYLALYFFYVNWLAGLTLTNVSVCTHQTVKKIFGSWSSTCTALYQLNQCGVSAHNSSIF